MTLEVLNRDRILSLITGEELCLENKKIDKFFKELFNGMYEHEIYLDTILFTKNIDGEVKVYMKQDSKYERLWCDYDLIWSFFKNEIGLKHSDIKVLIKERVEEAFKLKVDTPVGSLLTKAILVEEAFKLKVDTPVFNHMNVVQEVEEILNSVNSYHF